MAWSWLISNFRLRLVAPMPRRSSSSSPMARLRVLVDSRTRLPIAPSTAPRASRLMAPTFTRLASLTVRIPMPTSRLRAQAMRTSLCMPCRATIRAPRQALLMRASVKSGSSTMVHVRKTPITTSRQPTPLSSRRSSKRSREALSRPVTRPKFMTAMASMSPATLRLPIGWATLCRSTALYTTARRLTSRQRLRTTSTPTHLLTMPRTWSSPFSMPKRTSPGPAIS